MHNEEDILLDFVAHNNHSYELIPKYVIIPSALSSSGFLSRESPSLPAIRERADRSDVNTDWELFANQAKTSNLASMKRAKIFENFLVAQFLTDVDIL